MWGIVQKDSIERLIQKVNNLTTRVTALEDGGGGGPLSLDGDVQGFSNNNFLVTIQGQTLEATLVEPGTFWVYDADKGTILPIEKPVNNNMIVYSDDSSSTGLKFKNLNFAPNYWFESGIFTDYTMNVGYQFYRLTFDSITSDVNLEFPPLDADAIPIIVQLLNPHSQNILFTCASATSFINENKMSSSLGVMNFIAFPNIVEGTWIIVTLEKK